MLHIVRRFALLLAIGSWLALATVAHAQQWPTKPLRWIVPYPPGGPSEVAGRFVADRLRSIVGQPVLVENRPGAGGNIGADLVAKANDGHTFGVVTDTVFTVNPSVYGKMPFDPWKDLVVVTLLASFSQMLVCNPSVKANNLSELIALSKRESLSYASGGAGVPGHLATELLLERARFNLNHVPYKGPAPAATDVMGGQVPCGFLALPTVIPHVRNGRLKAFAVSSAVRSALAPDVPTVAEAGVPGYDATFYLALIAPRSTAQSVVASVQKATAEILVDPESKKHFLAADLTPLGNASEEAARILRADAEKWGKVIKRIGLRLD